MIDDRDEVVDNEVEENEETPALDSLSELGNDETEEQEEETEEEETGEEETQEEVEEEAPVKAKPKRKVPEDDEGMRNLRLAKIKAEKERDEMRSYIEKQSKLAYQQPQQQPQQQAQVERYSNKFNLEDDAIAEGKHLREYDARLQEIEQKSNDRIAKLEQQAQSFQLEQRLRQDLPDLANVINQENIDLLNDQYPELAYTLGAHVDPYTKAKAAYTMIKKLGISKEDKRGNDTRERILKNSKRPRSAATINPQKEKSSLAGAKDFVMGRVSKEKLEFERKKMKAILG